MRTEIFFYRNARKSFPKFRNGSLMMSGYFCDYKVLPTTNAAVRADPCVSLRTRPGSSYLVR